MLPDSVRQFFRFINRYFMVPVFRLGLGALMVNPLSGYVMVVKTVGRKSGKERYSPVNYTLHNGCVYCMAGWGQVSDWYRNLRANPRVELILPDGSLSGLAETAQDPEERRIVLRKILRGAGFAGFLEGFNPFSASDDELKNKLEGVPLVRIRPTGMGSGAFDPGGWAWILVWGAMLIWLFSPRTGRRR